MKIQETQSVQLPLSGTVNNLQITVKSFTLFPSSIEVIWQVSGETASKEGTLVLPRELISAWGTDDTIIQDYVLAQLGLVEEVIVEEETVVEEEPITEETTEEETVVEETVEQEIVVEEEPITEETTEEETTEEEPVTEETLPTEEAPQ